MIVYWLLFVLITLIQLIPCKTYKGNILKLRFGFILIFIYAAIRINYGNDYLDYENYFYYIKKYFGTSSYETRLEIGYVLLNKIMPSYRVLIIFLSAFTCFTYYWLFYKFIPPKYFWIGFLLMAIDGNNMLMFQLSGLRNAIAINIMAFSIPLIKERKLLLFSGLTVLAYYFHNSAIFYMPLSYFLATPKKFKIKDIIIWSFIVVLFLIISQGLLLKEITPFINLYFSRYDTYLQNASIDIYNRSIFMYGFVITMFIISFIILLTSKLSDIQTIIFKLSFLFIISLELGVLNIRMSQYFAPFLIIGTTIVLNRVKHPILKHMYLWIVVVFLIYSFFIVYMNDPSFSLESYHSIFN